MSTNPLWRGVAYETSMVLLGGTLGEGTQVNFTGSFQVAFPLGVPTCIRAQVFHTSSKSKLALCSPFGQTPGNFPMNFPE